jgi:hypothetical protein
MNTPKYLLLSATAIMLCATSRADIKTTHETSTGGKLFSKTTKYVRAGAQRDETTYLFGDTEQKSITITLCDKKQMLIVNPDLKMYTVTPLVEPAAQKKTVEAAKAGGKKTGTMTNELVSIKELGAETVGEYKTRCYEITTRMKTTGCMGDNTTTYTQRICLGDGADGGGDGACGLTSASDGGEDADTCQTSIEQIGDWSRYNKLMQGLAVRTRIMKEGTDETQMETKLTMISRAKLGDEWFSVPEDYKKVTSAELQAAQAKAMMEKMTAGANADADDADTE